MDSVLIKSLLSLCGLENISLPVESMSCPGNVVQLKLPEIIHKAPWLKLNT